MDRAKRRMIGPLTPRELAVLTLLATELPTKLIADELHVSVHVVKFHLAGVYSKLGVSSRVGAVLRAIRLRLITVEGVVAT